MSSSSSSSTPSSSAAAAATSATPVSVSPWDAIDAKRRHNQQQLQQALNNNHVDDDDGTYHDIYTFDAPPPQTFLQKLWTKTKNDPIVPIGSFVTAGCLGAGLWSMVRGTRAENQKWMRNRILAQAVTLGALTFAVWKTVKPDQPTSVAPQQAGK